MLTVEDLNKKGIGNCLYTSPDNLTKLNMHVCIREGIAEVDFCVSTLKDREHNEFASVFWTPSLEAAVLHVNNIVNP